MIKPCSNENCDRNTGILTYDGKPEPLCYDHYMERVDNEKQAKEGLYTED